LCRGTIALRKKEKEETGPTKHSPRRGATGSIQDASKRNKWIFVKEDTEEKKADHNAETIHFSARALPKKKGL